MSWEIAATRDMIRDEASVVKRLTEELGLGKAEAEAYLEAIEQGVARGDHETIRSLLGRGMLIASADEKGYLPVHPRLALSNLFRSYGDRTTPEMREKRKMVDKLTAELVLVYEKRKGLR